MATTEQTFAAPAPMVFATLFVEFLPPASSSTGTLH